MSWRSRGRRRWHGARAAAQKAWRCAGCRRHVFGARRGNQRLKLMAGEGSSLSRIVCVMAELLAWRLHRCRRIPMARALGGALNHRAARK